jgi:tetratricopeptide (TPR) repeat protein
LVKCSKCKFDIAEGATFCPKCGTPVAVRISDDDISQLIFRRFGKKYDEALEAAHTALLYGLDEGTLHKDLILKFQLTDLWPTEAQSQDEAIKRLVEKQKGDSSLQNALSQYKLGLIYENGRKFKDAVSEYDKVIEQIPDFAPALYRRGCVQFAVFKKRKQGSKDLLKAVEADPQFSAAYFQQGMLLKIMKKRDEALESYKKCVALDPDNAAAHNNMGLIYTDKRDYENAEREFNEILRIYPNHPTGLKNLELAKKRRGRGGLRGLLRSR